MCLSDQFVTDPAAIVNRATGNQMVHLCRSICAEEKAQLLSLLMNSSIFRLIRVQVFSCLLYMRLYVDRTERSAGQIKASAIPESTVHKVLRRQIPMGMRRTPRRAPEKFTRKTLRMRRKYTRQPSSAGSLVTGLSHASNKPSQLHCRVCRKNVSVLTHGHLEGVAAFPRQSSLCTWSALATENTWVARAGFPRKSIKWGRTGASRERKSEKVIWWYMIVKKPGLGTKVLVGSVGFRNHFRLFPDSHCCFAFSQSS